MKPVLLHKTSALAAALIAAVFVCAPAQAKKQDDLFDMADQLDQIDKGDFQAAIDRANDCTRARDFSCSERELAKAGKLTNGAKDKKVLAAARQGVVAEKARIAEEERQRAEEERRLAEAREERERQARREEEEREERQSARNSSAENYAAIMGGFNSNLETLANMNRQNNEIAREYNRVQAERAAEQRRIRAEQMEREAEQRREARQMREAQQSRERLAQADARDRQAQQRLEAERTAERQRQEREEQRRKDEPQADTRNRQYGSSNAYGGGSPSPSVIGAANQGNPSAPVAAKSKSQSRKSSFLPAASEPNPYGDSNGHGVNGWVSLSAGRGQTREAACSEATNNGKAEIARLSTLFRNDAISPCVCSVNTGLGGGFWESMAEANEPNQWACRVYEKRTKIRDPGNVSK